MKKILYIGIAAVALLFTACDMDQMSYSEVAANSHVSDDESVNTLVVGTYNALHDAMYYEWALTELRSDDARCYSNNSTSNTTKLIEQLDQNTITPEHEWVESCWKGYYGVIANANNVIGYLDKVSNETKRRQYEGEARFLRALEYFNLVRLWGPVFIVETKVPSEVARNMQRSSVEEVYALIESDLEQIVNDKLLPDEMPTADLGRADLVAAKALLAKVYATHYQTGDEKYAKAITLCNEVLQARGGNLIDYESIFDIKNEMNREIIFAVRYMSGNVGLGSPFGNLFAPLNNGGNVIIGTSRNCNTPSDNIIAAYKEGDKRLDVNIAQRYYNATTGRWVTTGNCRYCKKYVNEITTDWDGESDWPVIRMADIALLYAELKNETEGPSADALGQLNRVRERAGVQTYTLEELSTQRKFRTAVRLERRLELAFENQRWFDLMRWHKAAKTVNAYFQKESFYSGYAYEIGQIEPWQTILPIPISVININPAVQQNEGYGNNSISVAQPEPEDDGEEVIDPSDDPNNPQETDVYVWRDRTIYGQSRQAEALASFFSPETGLAYLNSQWRTLVDPVSYKYQAKTCSDRNKPAVSEEEYNSVKPYFYLAGMAAGTLQVSAPSSSPTMLKNFYMENNSADEYRITGANADCYGTPAMVFLWLNPADAGHKKLIDEVHNGTLTKIDEQTFPVDVQNKTCRGFSISNMQRTMNNTVWANGVFKVGQEQVADVDGMMLVIYYDVNGEDTSNRALNIRRIGLLHIKQVDFRMNGSTENPSASSITFDMYWQKTDYDYTKVP